MWKQIKPNSFEPVGYMECSLVITNKLATKKKHSLRKDVNGKPTKPSS